MAYVVEELHTNISTPDLYDYVINSFSRGVDAITLFPGSEV